MATSSRTGPHGLEDPGAAVARAPGDDLWAVSNLTREVLRGLPNVALFVFDHDLRFRFCEGSNLHARGHDPREIEGRTLWEVLGPAADALEPMYRAALAGETLEVELDSRGRRYSVRAAPLLDGDGASVGGSLLSLDVTERHLTDRVVREGLERVDRIASNVPGVVYQVRIGGDGTVSYPYVSDGIRDLVGISPADLQADPSLLRRLIHPEDLADFEQTMAGRASESTPSRWEGRVVLEDGTVKWLRIASRRQLTEDGSAIRDGVAIDVTERRTAEAMARWRLEHDVLTGLPNRSLFLGRLEQALVGSRAHGSVVGVCFVDIDRFKQVNDALGHAAGDDVLRAVSDRIRSCLGPRDTLARHGGDELTVLLPGVPDRDSAVEIAERIVAACQTPVRIDERDVAFSCSIGVAVAPDDSLDAERLLSCADAAMYRAKEDGRARVEVFDATLARQKEEHLWLERRLRAAIEQDELHLVYQPQVDREGVRASVEALLRWHPVGSEPIEPDVFVPLAEEIGLIRGIGAWVLRRACEQAATWATAGTPLRVCVNLSPAQLADAGIVGVVATTLHEAGLPASLLELELTATAIMDQRATVIPILHELRALGVRVSLDDFGTGYSSLARLRHLPLDALKIDASFVAELGDGFGTAIVQTIVELAHTLGLEATAEGVETAEQQSILSSLGCDRQQGYLIGRPSAEVPPLLELDTAVRRVLTAPHAEGGAGTVESGPPWAAAKSRSARSLIRSRRASFSRQSAGMPASP